MGCGSVALLQHAGTAFNASLEAQSEWLVFSRSPPQALWEFVRTADTDESRGDRSSMARVVVTHTRSRRNERTGR